MQNLCLYHITFILGSHFVTTSGAFSLADCYKIERQRSFEENILPVYGVTLLMISVPHSTE